MTKPLRDRGLCRFQVRHIASFMSVMSSVVRFFEEELDEVFGWHPE
jgi:hypothetical protein